jgi:chromosome segregation ATPase
MRTWAAFFFLTWTLAAGCGGGLKYKIDDQLLYDVPVAEKQGMLAAEAEIAQAREEKNKAQADIARIDTELSQAESEYGIAKLELEKAEAGLKLAEQSKDLNRVNAMQEQLKLARLGKQVAAAKVDWLKRRRKAHKAHLMVTERHADLAVARYEQEKARLAQAKGKKPSPDFNPLNFDQQVINVQRQHSEAQQYAMKISGEASQLEVKYNQMLSQYQTQRGQQPQAGQPAAGGTQPNYQPPR